ncbi:hypothetical protein CC80DRAFT_419937 [Byssothecium circinans]|uniref:Uncharacterized protein n=1 Tax=Byssothecium circinans TaxID=147558 RepID=A0A6A5TM66_9PLEO|nr:hypothetical protein CC80DRAFT_419937 [Byssothecium circinans]
MSTLSPEKLNVAANHYDGAVFDGHLNETVLNDDDWQNPPSSPFESHIDHNDQENVAPTPIKSSMNFDDEAPQSAFKMSPEKKFGLKERMSPVKMAQSLDGPEEGALDSSTSNRASPKKSASPTKQLAMEEERPGSARSNRSRRSSPSKSSRIATPESTQRLPAAPQENLAEAFSTPTKRPSLSHREDVLRENEGLTVAMRIMDEKRIETQQRTSTFQTNNGVLAMEDTGIEDSEFDPDGPEPSSVNMDDTCFSAFSEMPGIDMTKFASLRQSPTRNGLLDQTTPRARAQMTPSTVRRTERTPSPTPRRSRKDGDTTNLLLDFTAQFEAFSTSRRGSPRSCASPPKSTTEPNLLSFYNNQRSPGKGASANVLSTPRHNRPMLNLLDFELPPAPTPRSVPTVTIRELESLKSSFQSQISSLSASLSGKEAQVESLVKAVSDAERRVGEAQELLRDERSAREHSEAQMEDWRKKGEEVQSMLAGVQADLTEGEAEREQMSIRLAEVERRAEEAEQRSSELETRLIEAESKNVDMTTFINPDEDAENKKIYSEIECQTAIAEKVNEVARDLHAAYKAKHEKKIKALKESYQKKADERCKELRLQIIRLERRVEEAEKKHDTFSKVIPDGPLPSNENLGEKCEFCNQVPSTAAPTTSLPADLKQIEAQRAELESLKAKLAGLQSELQSLRSSQDNLLRDLEAERVEKGELVAAAEQMLAMCGEKMEEMQQEEFRKSQAAPPSSSTNTAHRRSASSSDRPAPAQNMRSTGFLAGGPAPASSSSSRPGSALGGGRPGSALGERGSNGGSGSGGSGSGIAKPSGLRAPGGFGYGGGASGLNRSMSGSKSRILSNIERMGGAGAGGAGRAGQE